MARKRNWKGILKGIMVRGRYRTACNQLDPNGYFSLCQTSLLLQASNQKHHLMKQKLHLQHGWKCFFPSDETEAWIFSITKPCSNTKKRFLECI
ncbi:hypothetical protein ACFX19_043367 [Malus domestica]